MHENFAAKLLLSPKANDLLTRAAQALNCTRSTLVEAILLIALDTPSDDPVSAYLTSKGMKGADLDFSKATQSSGSKRQRGRQPKNSTLEHTFDGPLMTGEKPTNIQKPTGPIFIHGNPQQ